ncbi:hypothetical protein KSP35_14675 [Aquihabitans sp. G128]|uniref:AAA family ATPase n=1 Tax=Aquihabitans sp. G128 TaxID=2849779 RepID=UPI001C236C07|nr:hypothetical protein [Aquihabitans sp. G128]QXC59625.1 hypothetical protein KSP35_14675 [Aquihabitans sp. G128]
MTADADGWERPIPHFSLDPFAGCQTVNGLASDLVRSALHKHVRMGRVEQSVRAAMELARTDEAHEHMLWQRLRVIAAEDIGLGTPEAIAVVAALHGSAELFGHATYERLEMAAQAAGYLATVPKDPTVGEIMQVVLHEDRVVDIPAEAVDIHTERGQVEGRTMYDWFTTGTAVHPEVAGRDRTWHHRLDDLYFELDPPADGQR